VLARLPDAPAATRGISLFVAPEFLVNPDGTLGGAQTWHPRSVTSYGDKEGAIAYLVGHPKSP
jgi:hypothetical protein